jgi:hypothetical protein
VNSEQLKENSEQLKANGDEKRMPGRPEGAPGIRKLTLAGPVTWTEPCQE